MRTMDLRPPWSLRLAVLMCWLYGAVVLGLMLDSRPAVLLLTAVVLTSAWAHAHGVFRHARTVLDGITPFPAPGREAQPSAGEHFISHEFAAAQQGRDVSLVLFRFDRFDAFMEREGPEAGAEALSEFGAALKHVARDLKVPARYGWRGNAFLAVLPESDAASSGLFAERVQQHVRRLSSPMPEILVGLARFGAATRTPEEFVEAAERALAAARAEHLASGRATAPSARAARQRVPA